MSHAPGISFVEALMVTFVGAVLGLVAYSVLGAASRVYVRENVAVAAQNELASTRELVLRDLMMTGYPPNTAAYDTDAEITAFQAAAIPSLASGSTLDRLSLVTDLDYDDVEDRITYDSAGGRLVRQVDRWDSGSDTWVERERATLAENVERFDVVFRSAGGAVLTDSQATASGTTLGRTVEIALAARCAVAEGLVEKLVTGRVEIRN